MKKLFIAAGIILSAAVIGFNFTGFTKAEIETRPFFNQYDNVNGIGDEKDFLRVQNDDGTRVNTKEVCSGETKLWIYVHNNQGSSQNDDPSKPGEWDGVGVARDTKVKLSLPGTYTNSTTATAKVSASNSINAPTDTAFITCGSKKVKVEYVGIESVNPNGNYTLTGDIMSAQGATLNYKGMNGIVPGCWEYRASIVVKVKITPEPPKEQKLSCDVLNVAILNDKNREVEAKVMGSAQNTIISAYKIDFGDNTVVNEQTAKHTYADYGKYTIKGYVTGTVDGKTVTVGGDGGCVKTVEFKKPPEPQIQSIKCDALNLDLFNKDKKYVKVSVDATAQNTKIDKYEINFGDGSSPVMEQTAEHTYGDYGTFKIVAKVTGKVTVDGETTEVTDTNVNCEQTVEFKKPGEPETPVTPELPNTGAGAVLGLFSGVSLLGAVGHRLWITRKLQ